MRVLATVAALTVLAAAGIVGWSSLIGERVATDSTDRSKATSPTAAEVATTTTTLPPPWEPGPGEPEPDLKRITARAVQVVLSYGEGEGTVDAARARLVAAGLEPALAGAAGPFLDPEDDGLVEILYPQLAGLTATEASVMVVARFIVDGESTTRTVDVRATRMPTGWRPTAIVSFGGAAPTDNVASDAARSLLDDERVTMPDTARWDLERGLVDDRLAEVLSGLAETYELSIAVFASGHPANVFGTDRMSNHTEGRGVDVWAVNGIPVAAQRESAELRAIVDASLAMGVTELGAPIDIDGRGGIVFTNTVHIDHLHLAFER